MIKKKKHSSKQESIEISPKYGVNPSVCNCYICNKAIGVTLMGKLKKDIQAPTSITAPDIFCPECQQQLDEGNSFVLEVCEGASEENPQRTGRYVCLKNGAIPEITHSINYMEAPLFKQLFDKFLDKEQDE